MKTIYTVNEAMGAYSNVVGAFDTEEEASDYVMTQAIANIDEEEDYDSELQLQLSYFSTEKEVVTLETQYPDCNNEGEFIPYGNDIIDTFYNGNFSQGIKQLKEINVSARAFGNYIFNLCEEMGYESVEQFANNYFDYEFFICLGEEL